MEERNMIPLIEKSKSGDLKAFEELLRISYATVAYKCRRMLGNEQDAEDLTQDILLIVYTKLNTLGEPDAFWGWLNRIATNRCYNFMERTYKELQFAEDEEGNSYVDTIETLDERQIPDKAMDNAETARMIDEIVAGLPDTQRAAILMYYYDEMSVKEIARTMNIPEGTAKRRLDLARNKIEKHVKEYEKQGIKLYSVPVLPFLWYYLRSAAELDVNVSAASTAAANVMAGSHAAAGAIASSGSGAAGGATAHMIGTFSGKLIAGIAATAILIGGGAAALGSLDTNENNINSWTQAVVESTQGVSADAETVLIQTPEATVTDISSINTAIEAYAGYEALLTRGITDRGMQIAYYGYIDLNQDGIPELVVADADGTPNNWTKCEVYTFRNGAVYNCGSTSSRYEYFYHVNDEYLLGMARMGNQFLSVDGFVTYADKEYDYYNTMPIDDYAVGFIKSAEPIILAPNSFLSTGTNIVTAHYVIHLPLDWDGKYLYEMTTDDSGRICVTIYERTNHEAGKETDLDGMLATVVLYGEGEDYSFLSMYEYKNSCFIGEREYDIVVMHPSDVRFIWEDPGEGTYMEAYNELYNDLYEDWHNVDPKSDHLKISVNSQVFSESNPTSIDEEAPISSDTILQIFNDAKDFYDLNIYGRQYIDANEYPIEEFSWIDGVLEYEGCLYEPFDKFTYDEFVARLRSFFAEDAVAELILEAGLIEYEGKCYVYIRDGVGDPCMDYEATPQLLDDGHYEIQITIRELDGSISAHCIDCYKEDEKWVLSSGKFYG